jgi:hypothetical protein
MQGAKDSKMAIMFFKFADFDNEKTTVEVSFPNLTDGASWTTANTRLSAMAAVLADMSIGILQEYGIKNTYEVSTILPTSPYAQRESKWFVPYFGTTNGEKRHFTIPSADLTLLVPNTRDIDTSDAKWVAFVAEIENPFYDSPAGGNYDIQRAYHVGRNS